MNSKKEVIKFVNGNLELDVTVSPDNETVWLNRHQIAALFDRDVKTISKHINNAFKEELSRDQGVAKFATPCNHGRNPGHIQTQMIEYFNLDVIISVGYRVKSPNGIIFRKWANSVLKEYMLKGYAINKKRIEVLNRTVDIQSRMLASALEIDTKEIADVVEAYTEALSLLDNYDHHTIKKPEGSVSTYQLSYDECRKLIDTMNFKSEVFGVEKEKGKLEGILKSVYQNVFGCELYSTVEEKAASLLYFIIKDHPFVDGCKRIGASIFLLFLSKNNHLVINGRQIISNSALVAITLMIAESKPEEKEIMINLIMNFLKD